jgi:WD40 repeat protein
VAFSPDGKTLAYYIGEPGVRLRDVQTWQERASLRSAEAVREMAFSPDGKTLASAYEDGIMRLWNVRTAQLTATLKASAALNFMGFSSDGKRLFAESGYGVKVWDAQTGREWASLSWPDFTVTRAVFSPDSRTLACALYAGGKQCAIKLWDDRTRQECATLKGDTHYINFVTFSPDAKTLASASDDGTVRLWDASLWQRLP